MTYAMNGLGDKATGTRKPGSIVSPSAERSANAIEAVVRSLREMSLLEGATYNTAKYNEAIRDANSALNRAAGQVGMSTLTKQDVQQIVLGGLGVLQVTALGLHVIARIDTPAARLRERQVMAAYSRFVRSMTTMVSSIRIPESVNGLGILVLAASIALLAGAAALLIGTMGLVDYLAAKSELEARAQDMFETNALCPDTDPECTPERRREILENLRENRHQQELKRRQQLGDMFGFDEIAGSIGTVIKVVGITAAAGVGLYLLWVAAPVLIRAGKKARSAGKKVTANRRRTSRRALR